MYIIWSPDRCAIHAYADTTGPTHEGRRDAVKENYNAPKTDRASRRNGTGGAGDATGRCRRTTSTGEP